MFVKKDIGRNGILNKNKSVKNKVSIDDISTVKRAKQALQVISDKVNRAVNTAKSRAKTNLKKASTESKVIFDKVKETVSSGKSIISAKVKQLKKKKIINDATNFLKENPQWTKTNYLEINPKFLKSDSEPLFISTLKKPSEGNLNVIKDLNDYFNPKKPKKKQTSSVRKDAEDVAANAATIWLML
jgi:ElaB/YqjD/DUF883 family membrane-anchored ribosome-binding protein